jgi:hypothetical protein
VIEVEPPAGGYEDGRQAGAAAAGSWRPAPWTRLEGWRRAVLEAPTTHCLVPGRTVEEVLADLDRWTREDQLVFAADLHRRKMDALPDLARFPELSGMDRYLDELARGFADGAGIDVREVYLERYWRDLLFHTTGGGTLRPPPGSCSEHFFADTPDGPLMGKGWDDILTWYVDNPFPLRSAVQAEIPCAQIPPAPEGAGYRTGGIGNEAGLCVDTGGGATFELEPERSEPVFPAPVVDIVSRRCDTVFEAVEILTRYTDFWGPCNCIVCDAGGDAVLIEKSKYSYGLRASSRGVLITTYGGCDDEDLRRLTDMTTPLFRYYERRLAVMKQVVAEAEAEGALDVDVYWRSVLHHDAQAPGCQHVEREPEGAELLTMGASAQLPLQGRRLTRTIARDGDRILPACETPVVESRCRYS